MRWEWERVECRVYAEVRRVRWEWERVECRVYAEVRRVRWEWERGGVGRMEGEMYMYVTTERKLMEMGHKYRASVCILLLTYMYVQDSGTSITAT